MILKNPLRERVWQAERIAVADLFQIPAGTADGHYEIMRRYLYLTPERFFARDVHLAYLDWLVERHSSHPSELRDYMTENITEIGRALLFLREINIEDWHDTLIDTTSEWELLRFIETKIHRAYLRLVEGVLTPLVRVVAFFHRIDRNAGVDGLDTFAISKELDNSPLSLLVRSYHHTLRNGVGHGGLIYHQNEISYRDKKGNEATLGTCEVVRLFDDLLDDCNGLVSALTLFLMFYKSDGYQLPEALLVQELAEETAAPWWFIEGAMRLEIASGSQLNVFARTSTKDFQKILFSVVQSGILAEALVPGYDRYFLSIRGVKSQGWVALFGDRLRVHRTAGHELSAYSDIVESKFFFPDCKWPGWFHSIETIIKSFFLHLPLARREWIAARGIPQIVPRRAAMHANSWHSVLNGEVVIEQPDPDIIRKFRRRIIWSVLGIATRTLRRVRYYPLGFAQVAVFCRDYRKRRLKNYGLGDDLVCTVRYQSLARIRSLDISGSTVETLGPWRIAWNRAWLEREQIILNTPLPWCVKSTV